MTGICSSTETTSKELFRDETLVNGSRLLIEDDLYSELVGDENE